MGRELKRWSVGRSVLWSGARGLWAVNRLMANWAELHELDWPKQDGLGWLCLLKVYSEPREAQLRTCSSGRFFFFYRGSGLVLAQILSLRSRPEAIYLFIIIIFFFIFFFFSPFNFFFLNI